MIEGIRREMRRRSAVELVIGHLKDDRRMGRNHLAQTICDAAISILAAVGYNFRPLPAWLKLLLSIVCGALAALNTPIHASLGA